MTSNFTSSTAYLPDGNHLLFTDSGAPGSADYTTVVFLHGSSFHAKSFESMHGYASAHNARVITVQRKDYPGSSVYTDAELDDLKNGSKSTLDGWAIMMAHLVNYFVENLSIPKICDDRKNGGIALVAWSMGTVTAMSLFSDMEVIPKGLHPVLETYVRDVILYDPPHFAFGIHAPENNLFEPFTAKELQDQTLEQKFLAFTFWVGSYFDFPHNYDGDINNLDGRMRGDRGTFDNWELEDVKLLTEPSAGARSEFPLFVEPMQSTLKEMSHRTFFDKTLVQHNLPKVRILYIACMRSVWFTTWAAYKFREMYDEYVSNGKTVRPVHFTYFEDENHFPHIEAPEKLLKAILKAGRQ